MNFIPSRLCWLLLLATFSAALGAEQGPSPVQLQKWLKRYPDADANHDGTLSPDEARAYRQKLTAARKDKSDPGKSSLPKPTFANVSYGPHKSNVLDLWLAMSDRPTPLVVFIHGGGFVGGDKSQARPADILRCLGTGVSFMTINYRFRKDAAVQDILRDAARAIQFVRFNAAKYNLDPKRIASYGGSAGAGTSLWLAVHDDLADPQSTDPVLRQFSRILAAGCINGQATYDLVEWEKVIGKFKPEWRNSPDEDVQFYHFKSHDDFNTPAGQKVLDDCSMLRQITPGDAPIFMTCSLPDTEPNSRNHLLHHPRHMQAVKQKCDEAGVEVHTVSTAGKDAEKGVGQKDLLGFLLRHVGATDDQAGTPRPARRFVLACERDLLAAKALVPSVERLPADARRYRKLEFTRTPQGPLYLDLYLPANAAGRLPLIVWIHGGGWHTSPTARDDYLPGRMVKRGYALASIDYRDSKTAPFPAQIQDCKAALRWLRAHADEYGIDPERVGVWGISAGGHLAAFLGLSGGEKEYEGEGGNARFSSRVQAACDFCGPTDLLQLNTPETTNAFIALRQMAEDFLGGKLEERRDLAAKANPATHADAGDPPMLILHGDADPLIAFNQSELLYQALKAAGVEVTLAVAKGGGHLFVGREIDRTVDDFFDQQLKVRQPARWQRRRQPSHARQPGC
jgi:acetyl esterase/lipase